MGSLPFSIGFSLILALVAWFSFARMVQERSHAARGIVTVAKAREAFTHELDGISKQIFTNLSGKEREEDITTRRTIEVKTKKNAKSTTATLHVRSAFSEQSSARQETELKLFRNLMKVLYGSLPLFGDGQDSVAGLNSLFDEVRSVTLTWDAKKRLSRTERFCNVQFQGPNAVQNQYLLAAILKGANAEIVLAKRCYIPELCLYVSTAFREHTCMSVYKAPWPLLLALFQDPVVVQEVMAYRTEMYKKLTSQKKEVSGSQEVTAESLEVEFRACYESKIPSGIDAQFIDFHVTKGKPINFQDVPVPW